MFEQRHNLNSDSGRFFGFTGYYYYFTGPVRSRGLWG